MSTETRHIVNIMTRTARTKWETGLIANWKAMVVNWAERNPLDPHAMAVASWLPHWQTRPFYTAEELAPMWPALAIATGFTDRWPAVLKSAKRLEHELDFCGLPRLIFAPRYFIVERIKFWQRATDEQVMQELQNAQR